MIAELELESVRQSSDSGFSAGRDGEVIGRGIDGTGEMISWPWYTEQSGGDAVGV